MKPQVIKSLVLHKSIARLFNDEKLQYGVMEDADENGVGTVFLFVVQEVEVSQTVKEDPTSDGYSSIEDSVGTPATSRHYKLAYF